MTERWRRELRRLDQAAPSDGLLERARRGPTRDLPEGRVAPRGLVVVVAFALFAASGALVWRALEPGGGPAVGSPDAAAPTYPSPPASGYYILLPDRGEQITEQTEIGYSEVRVTALTNLPDGTLLDISTTDMGTCCPSVEDSTITFTTQDGACYDFVGDVRSGTTFDVTITAKPSFEPWIVPGGGVTADGEEPQAPQQPPDVLAELGPGFENLTGDQVQQQPDGSKWLVATGRILWPQPRCGGEQIPLFGGPTCEADRQQLQGDDLSQAMGEVMGAISQGRMCEFWNVMLPPDVEAEHPWPAFAEEWRAWLLQQDFTDAEPSGDWSEGPLHWVSTGSGDGGERYDVNIVHDGQTIASLTLQPLPDFCPDCNPNVVPFWGVTSWELSAPGEAPTSTPEPPSADAATEWPSDGQSLLFASVDEAVEFLRRNLDVPVELPAWLPPGIDLDGGASVYAGSLGDVRSAQLTIAAGERGQLIVQFGASALDGCASEDSVPVRISGEPGRLRYLPEHPWSELIWPATLAHPSGVYGLYGPFSDREILEMARSMPPVTTRVVVELNC
jgi:hypothetical protein